MNFKKEYENAFSDVKLDEDFKKNLEAKMNSSEYRKKKNPYVGILVAAAALMLVVGTLYFAGVRFGTTTQKPGSGNSMVQNDIEIESDIRIDIDENMAAQGDVFENYTEIDVSGLSWYGAAQSDEELLEVFLSYIGGNEVEAIYPVGGATLTQSDFMSEQEVENLVAGLEKAVVAKEDFTGEYQNYEAFFQSGMIIRFQISEEGYLKLEDTGTVYKFI